MRAEYCKYNITTSNNVNITVSHKTPNVLNNEIKEIENSIYSLFNNGIEWINKDNQLYSYMLITLSNKLCYIEITDNKSSIEAIAFIIVANVNPFLLLNGNKKITEEYADIAEARLTQSEVNYYYTNEYETIYKTFFQCIINNIDNNKKIYIKIKPEYTLFWFRLTGTLLPDNYYSKVMFSFGNNSKINYIFTNNYDENTDGYLFDFTMLDYPTDIIPKRYTYTIIDRLDESFDSCIEYRTSVNLMIKNHNLDISTAVNVINLIQGKIEAFTKVESLAYTIKSLNNIDYDSGYIASIIYTSLGKYEKNTSILTVYKFIYDNLSSSRNEIIELFFSNLKLFDIPFNSNHIEYLRIIEERCPFNLLDYLYYLKNKNIFKTKLDETLKDFNNSYLLLELICRDIKANNLSIVPNDDLLAYISYAVDIKNINSLDIILKRIKELNSKAASRLMVMKVDRIDKSSSNFILDIGLSYALLLFERIEPIDAVRFYQKAYNSVLDRRVFIKEYSKREEANSDYYADLMLCLRNEPDMVDFLERKRIAEIYKIEGVSLQELKDIYKEYYLNKYKNDNGVFLSKVIMYLDGLLPNERIEEAINIYNEFYRSLDLNYKDVFDSIRKLNDYIYTDPSILIKNDAKYYKSLNEIKNVLSKRKAISNPYFNFIELGLKIKGSYLENKYDIIEEMIKTPQFLDYDEDMKRYFVMYYLKYLCICYMDYLANVDIQNDFIFINGYHNLFDSFSSCLGFSGIILQAFSELEFNQFQVFYFLIMAVNTKNLKYNNILLKILDEIGKKKVKIYLRDYIKVLKLVPWLDDKQKNKAIVFINNYMIDKLNFIERIIWKLRCR